MTGINKVSIIASIFVLLALTGGCAAEAGAPVPGSTEEALAEVCPAIQILCVPGYVPKQLPNCHQICVPDNGPECETDADCGAIYCITEPCEQPVCVGRTCRLPPPGGGSSGGAGEPCGDIHCGAGSYCCNASCGICAPDGYACIQIACVDDTL